MAIGNERWVRRTALAGIWLTIAVPAAAQPERLPLRVVVYDYAKVTPEVLEDTERIVSRIFGAFGVDVIWSDVEAFTRALPGNPAERRVFVASFIQVRVVPPAMHSALGLKKNALGAAVQGTRCAWISFESVQQSARIAEIDLTDALGYVIAHEIGHLLLPAGSHAAAGLMREQIDTQLVAHNRLFFPEAEATLIRATLTLNRSETR